MTKRNVIRVIVMAVLIWFCFLIESTVMNAVSFGGIIPNLLVVLTAAFGFMRGRREGLLVGFTCGLLYDVFYGGVLGFYALIYMYIGFTNGFFKAIFYPEDIKLPLFLITFSDLCYGILNYILLYFLKGKFHFSFYFSNIILPETVYTVLVTVVLYPLIFILNHKLEESEKENAKKFI